MSESKLLEELKEYSTEEIKKSSLAYSHFTTDSREFAILKAREDAYLDMFKHIQSFENEDSSNETLEEDIIIEEAPFFYEFVIINSQNREDFIVKSDVLITQSNISYINKKLRVLRNEENGDYGAQRIYDSEVCMDYELLDGDFISYSSDKEDSGL